MNKIKKVFLYAILMLWGVMANAQSDKREFRGVWIATVKNIDWPTQPGLSTEDQKDEFRRMLDFHEMNGFNAVIVQVRPSADAFYLSDHEPWSRYLTGASDVAPDPYYDPLTFMIDEAHDRGLEFHAWFNPYRAVVDLDALPEDSTNRYYQNPEWFVQYGTRMYFDPGIPEVQVYTTEIIKDVTQRYDIDAIHFDDYFYPYRIAGVEFPDSLSFASYGDGFTNETRDDWRRKNVNTVIKMLSDTIKSVKPWVKFGISPFGVWRNKSDDPRGSDSEAGQTNYDDLFADVLLWMDEGWIDYVLPQLYLHMDHPKLSYRKVLPWWNELQYKGHIYVGHGTYRVGDTTMRAPWQKHSEVPNQIRMARKLDNILGSAHFSSKSFYANQLGITDTLRTQLYCTKALIPTMPWLDAIAPSAPVELSVKQEGMHTFLQWQKSDADTKYFVIYRFEGKDVLDLSNADKILEVRRSSSPFYIDQTIQKKKKYTYAITALDRLYNESGAAIAPMVKITKPKKK